MRRDLQWLRGYRYNEVSLHVPGVFWVVQGDLLPRQKIMLKMHWHCLSFKMQTCLVWHLLAVLRLGVLVFTSDSCSSRVIILLNRLWLRDWLLERYLDYGWRHFDLYNVVLVVSFIPHRWLVISTPPLAIYHKFELVSPRDQLVRSLQQKLEFMR